MTRCARSSTRRSTDPSSTPCAYVKGSNSNRRRSPGDHSVGRSTWPPAETPRAEREDGLWERITAERNRYFTPTGHERVERTALRTEVANARTRVDELEATLAGFEDDAAQVARLRSEAATLAEQLVAQDRIEADLAGRLESIERRRSDLAQRLAGRDTATAVLDGAEALSSARTDLVERANNTQRAVSELEAAVARAEPAREQAESARRAAGDRFAEAKEALAAAEADQRRAGADRDYRREQIEVAQLTERLDRVNEAERRRAAAAEVIAASSVDDALVERIAAAELDVARAEASVSTGATKVTASALSKVSIEVDGVPVTWEAGSEHELSVLDATELRVLEQISLHIKAGAGASDLAQRLADAKAVLGSICAEGQVAGLAEARHLAAARNDAQRVITDADKSIAQDLRDLTVDELARKVGGLTRRIGDYEATRSADPRRAGGPRIGPAVGPAL